MGFSHKDTGPIVNLNFPSAEFASISSYLCSVTCAVTAAGINNSLLKGGFRDSQVAKHHDLSTSHRPRLLAPSLLVVMVSTYKFGRTQLF